MITIDRVYEVFGIYSEVKDQVDDEASVNIKTLFKSSPLLLFELINACTKILTMEYVFPSAIKAIEAADSQNRKWPELLKELRL